MTNKKLKLITLLFALTFLAGAAFAATNGVLVFGGTVRINSVDTPQEMRLEFISTEVIIHPDAPYVSLTSSIIEVGGQQRLAYDVSIEFPDDLPDRDPRHAFSVIEFHVKNTGNVPVEFLPHSSGYGTFFAAPYGIYMYARCVNFPDSPRHRSVSHPPRPTLTIEPILVDPGETIVGWINIHPFGRLYAWQGMQRYRPEEFAVRVFTQNFILHYQQARTH